MCYYAYVSMLTSAYPKGLFGDRDAQDTPGTAPPVSATRPLRMSTAGTVLVTLFLVIGLIANVFCDTVVPPDKSDDTGVNGMHTAAGSRP
ncbi:hypothetical protein [Streptomyces sp. NBC_01089]|uniref:hypothetical protein n=1 Tax=Streptomyces sp. NBC_01089 TaxID=2903747 RepID=UPI00386CB540